MARRRSLTQQMLTPTAAALLSAGWAPLVGYDQFLHAASKALDVLARARLYAADCSAAQFQTFAQHVVHATELMQQPWRHGQLPTLFEVEFMSSLRREIGRMGANGLDARLVQLLAGAWERLQSSGVVQARDIPTDLVSDASGHNAFITAVHTSLTTPGLRSCALAGCGAKEAHPAHFKSCSACRTVAYCSKEHQVAGWPSHKKACKAARKAAAADDEAGPSGA